MIRYGTLILAVVFVAACSGDDESDTPAGAGGTGGIGGSSGLGGAAGGGMGGIGGGGIGGGGTGGIGGGGMGGIAGGGMGGIAGGGIGGTGGMDMDDDGGTMEMDDDGGVEEPDAGPDAGGGNTGEEGAQNGPCRDSGDVCDDGLGCYQPDENLPSFCTLECTDDDDCDALGGAEWTCWVMEGLCRVQCSDNGNDDCPADFECTDVLGQDRCVPIE